MFKIITQLLIATGYLVLSTTQASEMVDTSLVKTLNSLKIAPASITAQTLKEKGIPSSSVGLSLLRGRYKDAEHLAGHYAQMSEQHWRSIYQCAVELDGLESEFEKLKSSLTKLTKVDLKDVRAFGVVGVGNTAATASASYIVLGLEMICQDPSAEYANTQILKNYLAHELVHVVQYRLTKRTDFRFNLLELSLLEGSADFVAQLLVGGDFILNDERVAYGDKEGNSLHEEFKHQMLGFDYSPWLYTPIETMPIDMGYWIGFSLADGYMKNGGTLKTLLSMDDAMEIYDRSQIR